MTLDEAQTISGRIHEAAKALNTLIYEARAAGLDVDLEIAETLVVHGAPIKTVQTHVSLPLDVGPGVNRSPAIAEPWRLRTKPTWIDEYRDAKARGRI